MNCVENNIHYLLADIALAVSYGYQVASYNFARNYLGMKKQFHSKL